ncbi:hypothetical protein BESB_013220 [Besnoitia besnoiti]|uniref:Transmembrane protein n=1 Tax=Besnoitia besnoiti TaxID=94643 RepID=A0A2A9MBE3_BESBE|nr:hypothetical protein BESB_013220 [Besnoitia besnoiti]PFH32710.1 hypothetical protein BESB_013220 [Besnoitia besnoiti]
MTRLYLDNVWRHDSPRLTLYESVAFEDPLPSYSLGPRKRVLETRLEEDAVIPCVREFGGPLYCPFAALRVCEWVHFNMCGPENCCCGVPRPANPEESRMLLVGGIVNIVFPLGIGTLVAGCSMNNAQLIKSGTFQLICSLLIFGSIWSFIFGILMVVASVQASTSGEAAPAAPSGAASSTPAS